MTSAGDDWMREIERRQGYDAMTRDEGYGPMSDDLKERLAIWARSKRRTFLEREGGRRYLPDDCAAALHRIKALEAESEGALAIIATERAEVLKLREENARLRNALTFYAAEDVSFPGIGTVPFVGGDDGGKRARAALAEQEDGQ
jgi:hypothetical protein